MDEQEIANARPQWENHIEYVQAETYALEAKSFLAHYYPGQKVPKYAVQAILPRLNELGEQGWELVHMEPVEIGINGDIRLGFDVNHWTNVYLCAFKRLKRSALP